MYSRMTKDCDSQITKRHVTVHPKKIKVSY